METWTSTDLAFTGSPGANHQTEGYLCDAELVYTKYTGDIKVLALQIHEKAIVIRAVWYGPKLWHEDQQSRIKNPGLNPHVSKIRTWSHVYRFLQTTVTYCVMWTHTNGSGKTQVLAIPGLPLAWSGWQEELQGGLPLSVCLRNF